MNPRLSVSNIAWPAEERHAIYTLLHKCDVKGIEVAPTKIAPWDDLSYERVTAERRLLASLGLIASSYQALYFGRPDLQLLGDAQSFEALMMHTLRVARFAEQLSGGGPGVFGAPRNRLRGALSEHEAFKIGVDRFWRLAEAVNPYGFILAIEPAPAQYGGDFLQTTADCASMVTHVAHPALRLHLDTGILELTGEDGLALIGEHAGHLRHVHLSRPQLAPVDMAASSLYGPILRKLRAAGYNRWITIEMREVAEPALAVERAVRAAQSMVEMDM